MATTRAIELKTEIPGPRSREILERLRASVAAPLSITFPIAAAEARGATLTDVDGNTFVDFAGGVGCLNVGHSHPHVVQAAQEQLERFSHTDFTVVPYEIYATLSERLLALAPLGGPGEGGVLQRRHRGGRERGQVRARLHRPLGGDRLRGRLPRPHLPLARAHVEDAAVQGRARPVRARGLPRPVQRRRRDPRVRSRRSSRAEDVAAIVFEPVQGEGGFIPATQEFVEGVRAICDEHGIVMVCDEVQSGFARTGRFFAIEHFGVAPDLITVAKSIAMGIPLSGVLGKAAIMDAPQEGGVGGTYVGNPVAQAAALAVLDVIEDEGLVERSAAIGETIRSRMLAWQGRWPAIREVRGLGSMLAIELADAEVASAVVQAAFQRGLLLLKAGVTGNSIRVLVPLVIGDAELDEALDAWEQALESTL